MQRNPNPCTYDDRGREFVRDEVVEGFVDARDIDDDSCNLRHGTYEGRQSVDARG